MSASFKIKFYVKFSRLVLFSSDYIRGNREINRKIKDIVSGGNSVST